MAIVADVVRLAEQRSTMMRVEDLRLLGRTRSQIRTDLERQRLHLVHPGVVSSEPPPFPFRDRAIAVCLALPEGVVSFAAAAYLHGIRRSPREWLDVTIRSGRSAQLCDVHVHRTNHLPAIDMIQLIDGLRMTRVARTLFDLASVLDGPSLRSAVEDARNRQLVTDLELDEVAVRMVGRGRQGSTMFRSVVEPLLGTTPVQSHYESIVRDALAEAGIEAVTQHPLRLPNGRTVFLDLALVESRIDIELDPMVTHATRSAMANDKARDVQVTLAGWTPVRFTDEDVERRLRSLVGYVRSLDQRARSA